MTRLLIKLLLFLNYYSRFFNFSTHHFFVSILGCWNHPAAAAAIFSARPRKRRARGASRLTISPSWVRPSSATPTAPTARTLPCPRAATSLVMIHTIACLAPPMPHPPPPEITCAAIFPWAGDRRSRRYRRAPRRHPRRAQPAATRRRASPTAMPATAATPPMIWQVRARWRTRKR